MRIEEQDRTQGPFALGFVTTAPRKEEAMSCTRTPLLVAYRDDKLSVEAAEQLVRMAQDPTVPTHLGEELPAADRAALLQKARAKQAAR